MWLIALTTFSHSLDPFQTFYRHLLVVYVPINGPKGYCVVAIRPVPKERCDAALPRADAPVFGRSGEAYCRDVSS